ncbi:Retrovirus-related Pol polyprotein, partial [Mucuna pruriens]
MANVKKLEFSIYYSQDLTLGQKIERCKEQIILQEPSKSFVSLSKVICGCLYQPTHKSIIKSKWIFNNKLVEDGKVVRNKARLVTQDYNQQEVSISLKPLLTSLCYITSCFEDLNLSDHVFKLKRSLYGLMQAYHVWYDRLVRFLISNGFSRGKVNTTLFRKKKSNKDFIMLIISFLVLLINPCAKTSLKLKIVYGLQVKQEEDKGIYVHQEKYTKELFKKFKMEGLKSMSTSINSFVTLMKDKLGKLIDKTIYRGMISSLLYRITICNLENPENTTNAEVKVAKTEESATAQLATIFTTEIKSARGGRVKEEIKTQAGADINVQFGSEAAQETKADSNPARIEATESSRPKQPKAEIMSAHLVSSQNQVGQMDPNALTEPPMELKPLPSHLEYAYLDKEQQLPVIIANNLHREQEDKLLEVLRQHKKAIGWKLSDLPGINPSICMHRILMEEEIKPIRQQQRRLNLTLLDVVKKEVTKLFAAGIIYPISDSQWVSPVQVVPKKFGMTVVKNQHDKLVPTRIRNSWRVCIDYRSLNQATRKDHFPLPFIDQVLEKLARKSHYCFLDGFSGYMQIHIAPEDQHKTTFTCPFGTFAYTRIPFGMCNALSTFQRCMTSIFSDLLQDCMEVFMDDFPVYADSFEACLNNLSKVLKRCIDTNLVLNFEKCHFMVTEGIVLGHLVSNKGIEVDKSKIDIITSLPNPTSVWEVRFFWDMQASTKDSLRTSANLLCHYPDCYRRM